MNEPDAASGRPPQQEMNGMRATVLEAISQPLSSQNSDERTGKGASLTTSNHSSYTPQFSSVSQAAILQRITSWTSPDEDITPRGQDSPDSAYSATLSLPETSSSPYDLASLRASATHKRLSLKRKRANAEPLPSASASHESPASEFAYQTTLPLPTPQHTSYPQYYHPSPSSFKPADPPATCSKCHLSSAPGNILVSCAKCPVHIHQQCSTPSVDDFRARDGSFMCRDCLLSGDADGEDGKKKRRRQLAAAQEEDLERMRRRRLEILPEGVTPAKAWLVGFKGGDASTAAVSARPFRLRKSSAAIY